MTSMPRTILLTAIIAAATASALALGIPGGDASGQSEAVHAPSETSARKAKLPREWVWRKKAVNFDGMYGR